MARDATYQPSVYRSQGGDVLTISTTDGRLNIESGAKLVVKSGGYLNLEAGSILASSGTLTYESISATSNVTFGKASTVTLSTGGVFNSSGTFNGKTVNFTKTSTVTLSTGGTFNSSGTAAFKTLNLTKTATATFSTGCTVNSSGTLNIKTGSITSAGTLTVNGAIDNKGTITNSSDGQFRESVETKGPAGALVPYGISVIGTTAGATAYTMAKPPAAGVRKTLVCVQSTGALVVRCSSNGTLNGGTSRKITFGANADGMVLELIATTATNWQAIRGSTALGATIAFGTT